MRKRIGLWAVAFTLASLSPRTVAAQTAPGQTSKGPLIVERVHNGFVIAPDFKVTEVDDEVAGLAGAYGGWLHDDTLLIGGGGYWLANRDDDFKMAYGGLVVGWQARTDRRIGFGVRGLVGAGQATLGHEVTIMTRPEQFARFGQMMGRDGSITVSGPAGTVRVGPGGHITVTGPAGMVTLSGRDAIPFLVGQRFTFDEEFFIAEPQVDLQLKLTDSIRLNCGVGYRLIGAARGVEDRLQGVTGSVAIQFGR